MISSGLATIALSIAALVPTSTEDGPVLLATGGGAWGDEARASLEEARGDGSVVWLAFERGALPEVVTRGATEIDPRSVSAADVRTAHSADMLLFEGGTFVDWWRALTPKNHASALGQAVRAAHRRGACVVAHGGAALFVSGGTIVKRDELDYTERNPRRAEEPQVLLGGMGFSEPTLESDAHGGSLGRLLSVLARSHVDRAIYMEGDVACFAAGRSLTVHGAGRIWVLDLGGARRERGHVIGGRLSIRHGARARPAAAKDALAARSLFAEVARALDADANQVTLTTSAGTLRLVRGQRGEVRRSAGGAPDLSGWILDWEPGKGL